MLLAGILLLSCASCNPATPASSGEPGVSEPVPVGQRDKVVSLNGQWDLYVDTIEKVTVAKNKVSAGSQRVALNPDIVCGTVLTVKELPASAYYKIRAYVQIDPGCIPAQGQNMNGTPHWVDLSLRVSDLKEGENKVELCSTMTGAVYLLADNIAGSKAFTAQGESITAETDREYGIQIKAAQCGDKWVETAVPAAAEKTVTLSHMQDVRPDNYNGVVWYRRSFSLETVQNQDWWLCFDAVD